MNAPGNKRRNVGFSLIELLVGVIILAVLAVVVVPSLGASSEATKAGALKTDLSALRRAVELYHAQHNGRYPGHFSQRDGSTLTTTTALAAEAFAAQLVQYSDANGKVSDTRSAVFKYGPYVNGGALPDNPFLAGERANDVLTDITTADITAAATASGATGWKFYVNTGRIVANDNLTLSDGVTRTLDF